MYLDSSRRAANKRSKESLLSQPDTINRSLNTNDHLTSLIQSIHESMRDLKIQIETVDKKYEKSETITKDLRDSLIDLNEKVTELKIDKSCECSNKCLII
jgi:predicted  nucleic acid-binding Zn-ribbon protein